MSQFPYARNKVIDYGTDEKVQFNFFNAVYAWMAVGLAVTAVVAWWGSTNATLHLAELIMNAAISKALKDKRVREIQ